MLSNVRIGIGLCYLLVWAVNHWLFTEVDLLFYGIKSSLVFLLIVHYMILSIKKNKYTLNPILIILSQVFLVPYTISGWNNFSNSNFKKLSFNFFEMPQSDIYRYLNQSMDYVFFGFWIFSFFLTYKFIIPSSEAFKNIQYRSFIRTKLVLFLFLISIAGKLILIKINAYGVLSTYIQVNQEYSSYLNILNLISSVGDTIFILFALNYLRFGLYKRVFFLLFGIQLIFSLVSGYKGAIMINFLNLFLIYYLVQRELNFKVILTIILIFNIAYFVVTPYRNYIQAKQLNNELVNLSSLNVLEVFSANLEKSDESFVDSYLNRMNFLVELALLQQRSEKLMKDDPDFLNLILTAPFRTFIPRAIWPKKPESNLGMVWLTFEVKGLQFRSSSAFGVIGYFYYLGGLLGIFFGMLVWALFLKFLLKLFFSLNINFQVLALVLLNHVNMENNFDDALMNLSQYFILVSFVLWLISTRKMDDQFEPHESRLLTQS